MVHFFALMLYVCANMILELASEPSGTDENKIAFEITINLSFYALKEGSKDVKKRISCYSTYMKINSGEPFDTFKAQLLVRIDKQLEIWTDFAVSH
jgi:hypothetical protein